MQQLKGKAALVTGACAASGRPSPALAARGADVAISYVASADKANALVAELQTSGIRAAAFRADQADTAQVEGLVKAVTDHFGRLDILVNNAGVFVGGAVGDARADLAALGRQYAVNLFAVVTAIRAAAQVMGEGGRIITIGSGIATRASFLGTADYAATKAAIVGYTKGAARDLAAQDHRERPATRLDRERHEPGQRRLRGGPEGTDRAGPLRPSRGDRRRGGVSGQSGSVLRHRDRAERGRGLRRIDGTCAGSVHP